MTTNMQVSRHAASNTRVSEPASKIKRSRRRGGREGGVEGGRDERREEGVEGGREGGREGEGTSIKQSLMTRNTSREI